MSRPITDQDIYFRVKGTKNFIGPRVPENEVFIESEVSIDLLLKAMGWLKENEGGYNFQVKSLEGFATPKEEEEGVFPVWKFLGCPDYRAPYGKAIALTYFVEYEVDQHLVVFSSTGTEFGVREAPAIHLLVEVFEERTVISSAMSITKTLGDNPYAPNKVYL